MPGKVNPIIPEVVNQVAFEVIGNDITVTLAAEAGQLELNVMEPVIAYNLFTSLDMLGRACRTLADRCVSGHHRQPRGLPPDGGAQHRAGDRPQPVHRLRKIDHVADEALQSGRSVYEIVLEKGYLSQAELDDILSPENMTRPRYLHTGPGSLDQPAI